MPSKTPRQQRARTLRELDADLVTRERRRLADLRQQLARIRQERRDAVEVVRVMCARALDRYRRSAKARRAALEAELRAERETANAQCRTATARAAARALPAVNTARRALGEERFAQRSQRIWTRKSPHEVRAGRDHAREAERGHRHESDTEVENNVPLELVPVWRRLKRRFVATPRRSRTETFLEWAHDHSAEVEEILRADAEESVEDLVRDEESAREHAFPVRRRDPDEDVPF